MLGTSALKAKVLGKLLPVKTLACLFIAMIYFIVISSYTITIMEPGMRRKTLLLLAVVQIIALFFFCSTENPLSPPYIRTGQEALLIVVENNNLLDSSMSTGYTYYQKEMKTIFADVFEIKPDDIPDSLSLDEVIDQFGEDWQIRALTEAAQPFYTKIVVLTDEAATGRAVLDSLTTMCTSGYTVDMILNLHGSLNFFSGETSILFADSSYNLDAFTNSIKNRSACPRTLYQTCCYGSSMIEAWERAGITAVNGASDANSLVMFSPIYFLQNWTGGMTFSQAVQTAFNEEYRKIESYSKMLEEITMLLDEELLAGSLQETGGTNKMLLWRNFEQ